MSFLSAFSSFLGSPLIKTFTSGLNPLFKGELKGDEFLSSLLDQVIKLAPKKVGQFTKFVAPYIANIGQVNETLKRAALDYPSLQEFEPLKTKKVKVVSLDSRDPIEWKPLDSGGVMNDLMENAEPRLSDQILTGTKSIRDLPPISGPFVAPLWNKNFEGMELPPREPAFDFRPAINSYGIMNPRMGIA